MIAAWIVSILISIAITAITAILTPRPKQPQPAAAKQLDDPVAEAGKVIALVAGTITVSELNVLNFGDKSISTYKVAA